MELRRRPSRAGVEGIAGDRCSITAFQLQVHCVIFRLETEGPDHPRSVRSSAERLRCHTPRPVTLVGSRRTVEEFDHPRAIPRRGRRPLIQKYEAYGRERSPGAIRQPYQAGSMNASWL